MTRTGLEARWLDLTRREMPSGARERDWPVHLDHCFQRILLDNAVGAAWRTRIEPPAYRNADDATLARAIELGERAIRAEVDLADLNARSLEWRGKRKTPPRR